MSIWIQVLCIFVCAVFGTIESSAPPFGKCNTLNFQTVPLPVKEMEKYLKWRVSYSTDTTGDNENYEVTVFGGNRYKLLNKKVLKNKSISLNRSTTKYVDNVITETFSEANGIEQQAYYYPVAVTKSFAILIYSCSDYGTADIDHRFIVLPKGTVLEEGEIEDLLAHDEAVFGNSRGTLKSLPEELPDD